MFRVLLHLCLTAPPPSVVPQVLMVRFCSLFDPKERTVTFLNGQTYSLASLRALGMGCLLDAMRCLERRL